MGAGHTVTVLYEVIPAGVDRTGDDGEAVRAEVDPLQVSAAAAIRQRDQPRPERRSRSPASGSP